MVFIGKLPHLICLSKMVWPSSSISPFLITYRQFLLTLACLSFYGPRLSATSPIPGIVTPYAFSSTPHLLSTILTPSPTSPTFTLSVVPHTYTMTIQSITSSVQGYDRPFLLAIPKCRKPGVSIFLRSGLFRFQCMLRLLIAMAAGTTSWLRGSISLPMIFFTLLLTVTILNAASP